MIVLENKYFLPQSARGALLFVFRIGKKYLSPGKRSKMSKAKNGRKGGKAKAKNWRRWAKPLIKQAIRIFIATEKTQKQIAEEVGLSQSIISQITREPKIRIARLKKDLVSEEELQAWAQRAELMLAMKELDEEEPKASPEPIKKKRL
ncbi:hypothetical protein [Limnobacter sp.]|uniref:hypothetical protein n=1 Tax=Limnobacter sp. TaxID=2003368 RepID=UPI0027B895FE|nr:hypothetical protein [Limnobacter sp.]